MMSPEPVVHYSQWLVVVGCHEYLAISSLLCKTFQLPRLVGHADLTPCQGAGIIGWSIALTLLYVPINY